MLSLDPRSAALVLIDLQKGIVGRELAPHTGDEVVAAGRALAERSRAAGATVILVNVAFAPDFADAPHAAVDEPMALPPDGLPADFSDLVDGLAHPTDLRITKRNWGAVHGTELDLQLRRRGIRTIVLGGVATNFGVEGTAREAWQHGYDVVVAADAVSATDAALHALSFAHVLPRLARIRSAADIAVA